MAYETAVEIERCVISYFNPRVNIVVPNVSWGLFVHECDLFVLSKNNYATEVEIKISRSDIVKDKTKQHGHNSNKIKRLFFAISERLNQPEIIMHIPERAGIIVVDCNGRCRIIRHAKINAQARKLSAEERINLLRLAYLRYCNNRMVYRENLFFCEGLGI